MIVQINSKEIPFGLDANKLCCNPYPSHKEGCPNYNKKDGCPPNLPHLNDILNFNKKIYLIYTDFDIGKHAERMKKLHKGWSERQAYCCLYWQPKARKMQRAEEEKCKKEKGIDFILNSPEAYGVNVNLLMKKIGVSLEWPPRKVTRLISLGGMKI